VITVGNYAGAAELKFACPIPETRDRPRWSTPAVHSHRRGPARSGRSALIGRGSLGT